jgi:hypothetical protein
MSNVGMSSEHCQMHLSNECQMLGCPVVEDFEVWKQNSPPQLRRGGCAAKKSREGTLAHADGVVLIKRMIFLTSTTPAAATASAFPSSAEEGSLRARFKVTH